ncbi:MAG: T9SS type A sorting domain-containing protein [Bacteroidales bacterium]|nr:T9SS type A sorting domain-containing protein [Bacteroidales bacterium]
MKKITFLMVFTLVSTFMFAQTFVGQTNSKMNPKKDAQDFSVPTNYKPTTNDIKATVFFEDFEAWSLTWPPTDWTQIDGVSSAQHWAYSNDTEDGGNGTGQARVMFNYNQDEWLITPTISVPATGNFRLAFDWSMYYDWMVSPNDNGDFMIKISTDGGTNWTEVWVEDDQALVESPVIPWPWETYEWYTSNIDITSYAGQDIKIAFHYYANDAARVQIDNVTVYETYDYELVLTTPHLWFNMGGGYLGKMPLEQLVGIFFGAHVWNNGLLDAANVVLSADVSESGTSLYNEFKDTVILSAGIQDSIGIATGFIDFLGNAATYTVTMDVSSDGVEENMDNNSYETTFEVTNGIFARWAVNNGHQSAWNFVDAADGDYIGVKYYFPNPDRLWGIRVFISPLSTPGTTMTPVIYQSTETELLELVVGEEYDIIPADLGNWVTIELPDLTGEDLDIDGNFVYYAGFQCYWGEDTLLFGSDVSGAPHDYRYESCLYTGSTWYYFTGAPMIELLTDDFDSNQELNVTDSNVSVYPNPSNGIVNFQNVANAKISVYNTIGKLVAQLDRANETTTLDMSKMQAGTYIVKIEGNGTVITRKIVLTK